LSDRGLEACVFIGSLYMCLSFRVIVGWMFLKFKAHLYSFVTKRPKLKISVPILSHVSEETIFNNSTSICSRVQTHAHKHYDSHISFIVCIFRVSRYVSARCTKYVLIVQHRYSGTTSVLIYMTLLGSNLS
jgi:hypothetical protein